MVECLPRRTKLAMLEGISRGEIIVGAYSDDDGICPMLAAHRLGGRTNMISFARAWDRFAFRGSRKGKARRATERELLVLRTHLEASLLAEDGPSAELAAATAEHRLLRERRLRERASQPRPRNRGDRDRSRELRRRDGWAWLKVFRRYDEYQDALARVESAAGREREQAAAR